MKSIVLILTQDELVIKKMKTVSPLERYELHFHTFQLKPLLILLETDISAIFIDIGNHEDFCIGMLEIIKRIQPYLPIIALTDSINTEDMRQLTQKGIFYTIMKPIQETELENIFLALDRHLAKQKERFHYILN